MLLFHSKIYQCAYVLEDLKVIFQDLGISYRETDRLPDTRENWERVPYPLEIVVYDHNA